MSRIPFPPGAGIFETLRTDNGEIAELSRHMRRALTAANALSISMPPEENLRHEIAHAIKDAPQEIGRLRICIGESGLHITHSAYSELAAPSRLTFSSTTSRAEGEQFKRYPYDSHYEVIDQANLYGFDDAIRFNSANEVTETGLSNIALLIEDKWVTPPISAGILPGVMRAIAIERCDVLVRSIHISEFPTVQAALLLSSLKIAHPVSHIGEQELEVGQSLSLAQEMREKLQYFSVG